MNPIENVWAVLQAKVDARGCETFKDFEKAVFQEWERLDPNLLVSLYAGVKQRLAQVRENGGERIKH